MRSMRRKSLVGSNPTPPPMSPGLLFAASIGGCPLVCDGLRIRQRSIRHPPSSMELRLIPLLQAINDIRSLRGKIENPARVCDSVRIEGNRRVSVGNLHTIAALFAL